MKPIKDKVITFRMEEQQYNQLQAIAEQGDRTIAYTVNKICEEYLKDYDKKAELTLSYRLGKNKKIATFCPYPKEKIEKIKTLEECCTENKCTIFDLIDFLITILSKEDIERITAEYASGYLHEKYGIFEDEDNEE